MTRAELARLCKVQPSTIGDYLNGQIEVTGKNLAKILRGVTHEADQIRLLIAYLEDQIPEELREAVLIEPARAGGLCVEEDAPNSADPLEIIALLNSLSVTLRADLILMLRRLHDDTDLRRLISMSVNYLKGEEIRVIERANKRLGTKETS
jgi:transcriptional regulator with XRE-family HTH domain